MPYIRIAGRVNPEDAGAVYELASNMEIARWIRAVALEGKRAPPDRGEPPDPVLSNW